jgi:hypothetical protein
MYQRGNWRSPWAATSYRPFSPIGAFPPARLVPVSFSTTEKSMLAATCQFVYRCLSFSHLRPLIKRSVYSYYAVGEDD